MRKLENQAEFTELTKGDYTVFLFSAGWCGDCRFLDPFLPEIQNENKKFTFIHVDRDEFIDLCGQLDIFGIPSFIAYNQGNEIGRFVSKDRKTKEEVNEFLQKLA